MFFFSCLFVRVYLEFGNDVVTKVYEQKLDHFDVKNNQTFKQRYYENFQYVRDQTEGYTTALINIGGEGPLTNSSIAGGAIVDLCKRVGSALYSLEHRYFGESQPFNELTSDNLQYLTIQQALADLAGFIDKIVIPNGRPNTEIRIGVIGGSYPGSLSSWFRLKYPQYTYASWASSAPVLIKNDFLEYDAYIADQLAHYPNCDSNTKSVLEIMNEKIAINKTEVIETFGFNNDVSSASINYCINDAIAVMVQYNSRYQIMEKHCNLVDGLSYNGLVDSIKEILRVSKRTVQDFDLTLATNTSIKSPFAAARSWSYMTCRQVGWFQTASGKLRSEIVNLNYFSDVCKELFGIEKLADENELNQYFGGADPKQTKVFFLNGDVDPWSAMGVHTADEQLARRALVISGESHCADLGAVNINDSEFLKTAKEQVISQMQQWLNEPNCNGTCANGKCTIYGCICLKNWGGEKCDVQMVTKEGFDTLLICAVSIPVLLAVIIIFTVWIWFYKVKKPQTNSTPLLQNK